MNHIITLPPGFSPIGMSALLDPNPGLKRMLGEYLSNMSNKGLYNLYQLAGLEEKQLIRFAISPSGEPAVFTAPRGMANDRDQAWIDKVVGFWDKQGEFNPTTGAILKATAVTPDPMLISHPLPHWQVALNRKVETINALSWVEKLPNGLLASENIELMDIPRDLQALRMSEVFSFSADVMHAIMAGAQTIPHEAPLNSVEIPKVKAGWFWFAEPFPVTSSSLSSDTTAALLWFWGTYKGTPVVCFSAYVANEKDGHPSKLTPSTKWLWPLDASFHDMIALSTQMYRQTYGPGGLGEKQKHLQGETATMKVVAEMSLFFLMTCSWFKQTVSSKAKLTQEFGHIERHARKRLQKESKLDVPLTVRVIALRKTTVLEHAPVPEGDAKHHLTVRFIVSGHARLQACGPAHKDRKLIWVDPYPKGPEDAPFKPPSERVYAVVR